MTYFHLRAVPPSALRNSANWLQRLFEDDWDTVRLRLDRHREAMLDHRYLDHDALYPEAEVVLGGRAIPHPDPDRPPFLLLTAARASQVAEFLTSTDLETLWRTTRYGDHETQAQTRTLFASTHQELTAFYARTAEYGDAVVKWLLR